MKTLTLGLALLGAAAAAQAAVSCKFGGRPINVTESWSYYQYASSGRRDVNGYLSMFRLLTMDDSDAGNSVELKTIDVAKPGDHPLSKEPGWLSLVDVNGDSQPVTGGRFRFTRFEVQGTVGRAAGTVEFSTAQVSGSCTFDIEVQVMNTDALGR